MHGIGVVGCSYRHASAEQVARFALPKAELPARLPVLRSVLGGAEVVYLATCNRVEVLFAGSGTAPDLRPEVFRALTGREPGPGESQASLRTWTGEAAVEHLFLVACGLDSAQAGEQEIYVQLRAAWQAARETGTAGPLLDRIVSEALSMARHAHRLGHKHAPSLADLAVERVLTRAHERPGPIALLGVSPMTRRCGSALAAAGVPLLVVNRSPEPAQTLAAQLGARALALETFRREPPRELTALVLASGGSEPILDRACLERLAAARPLVVDFGLPPNVEPEVAAAVRVERIGMDELIRAAREDRVGHLVRLAPVRAAIDERLARLRSELAARAIGPQLAELRGAFERIAAAEVRALLRHELADLDAARRERLAGWATSLAHRLAHLPLSGLRAAAEHSSTEATQAFFREARLKRAPLPSEPESD